MILDKHPDAPQETAGMKAIGYWDDGRKLGLPDPKDFIDETWDPRIRRLVALYTATAPALISWRGYSSCRVCRALRNGSACLSDHAYVWPEGFAHYVERHSVKVPDEFVKHIVSKVKSGEFNVENAVRASQMDTNLKLLFRA